MLLKFSVASKFATNVSFMHIINYIKNYDNDNKIYDNDRKCY